MRHDSRQMSKKTVPQREADYIDCTPHSIGNRISLNHQGSDRTGYTLGHRLQGFLPFAIFVCLYQRH